ncbi:hypothetical protein SAMN05660484_02410 [Eubacterium ruminantium]|uniref:Uncharacterized protein n=2 Tax=Eubacterium ruminantium TaxID=42322 RepID=A0A1T4QBG2_9FIRM|nr:hypothetical protein [Eubacterium ruminantium]SCW66871.1 hypothetical protein SAMN05660484_02410 [Eubacterium ruminantium]SDN35279.1 hypothetical protein SAMN04490370_1184 [Eubacterium ruminantium]SKA00881.1 hypothetical protein SAMN02745110_02326 [Eubacterium ruminantium]
MAATVTKFWHKRKTEKRMKKAYILLGNKQEEEVLCLKNDKKDDEYIVFPSSKIKVKNKHICGKYEFKKNQNETEKGITDKYKLYFAVVDKDEFKIDNRKLICGSKEKLEQELKCKMPNEDKAEAYTKEILDRESRFNYFKQWIKFLDILKILFDINPSKKGDNTEKADESKEVKNTSWKEMFDYTQKLILFFAPFIFFMLKLVPYSYKKGVFEYYKLDGSFVNNDITNIFNDIVIAIFGAVVLIIFNYIMALSVVKLRFFRGFLIILELLIMFGISYGEFENKLWWGIAAFLMGIVVNTLSIYMIYIYRNYIKNGIQNEFTFSQNMKILIPVIFILYVVILLGAPIYAKMKCENKKSYYCIIEVADNDHDEQESDEKNFDTINEKNVYTLNEQEVYIYPIIYKNDDTYIVSRLYKEIDVNKNTEAIATGNDAVNASEIINKDDLDVSEYDNKLDLDYRRVIEKKNKKIFLVKIK